MPQRNNQASLPFVITYTLLTLYIVRYHDSDLLRPLLPFADTASARNADNNGGFALPFRKGKSGCVLYGVDPVKGCLLTNGRLTETARTKAYGKRRMWIETVLGDWQSGGFHLDQCGVPDTQRLTRLLLVLAIAYLWLVSLGRWVVKRGYRRLIDDGTPRSWHFSLFQLGVGWKEHLHSFTQPLL